MFDFTQIVEPLLEWYDKGRRVLPWREEPTPYRVWISEIMLQQTRVEAVKPYFERFMMALPNTKALAEVEEESLLKLWEGLGYYNRARNLQKAAIQIEEQHNGCIPSDYDTLLTLSGIGRYTAGAIASIAYGEKVPAVDGNVLRVIARVSADDGDILTETVKRSVEQSLLAVMPEKRAGDFNQALMELGAMVCIPNGAPKCEVCPWYHFCEARMQDKIDSLPKKTPKKARTIEKKTILVIRDENKAALRKRPSKGLLAGLYEFPSMEGHRSSEDVIAYLKDLGLQPLRIQKLPDAKHIFTHKEWHMTGYIVRVDELAKTEEKVHDFLFIETKETEEQYPIPSAFVAYTKYLNIKIGNDKFVTE
ncbi:MAG: A/G-specific adenine glycosylase [Lachnospiraceae bacterium]|nr:A/G-specific adenine glycosylase [Lachnospiraceae bacterium]